MIDDAIVPGERSAADNAPPEGAHGTTSTCIRDACSVVRLHRRDETKTHVVAGEDTFLTRDIEPYVTNLESEFCAA